MSLLRLPPVLLVLVLVASCTTKEDAGELDLIAENASLEGQVFSGIPFTAEEQAVVLDMANNATLEELDVTIGLNSRAATNIVAGRPIADMAALDAVSYVGVSALEVLKAYVPQWTGVPSPDTQLLEFVNHPSVTFEELDHILYIGPTQAQGIIDTRALDPIDSVDELLAASASAGASPLASHQLESLRNYANSWQVPPADGSSHEPGTWAGVVYSGFEATAAMQIVNCATFEELDDDVGLASNAAQNIVNQRPLASMDALDAVPYVATKVFQQLKGYVPSWTPPAGCTSPEPDPDPPPDPGGPMLVSGVYFTAAEITVALDLVNNATTPVLDDEVGLDTRAVNNIIAARLIADMPALDNVSYVGSSALEKILAYLPTWTAGGGTPDPDPEPDPAGGTYDGVEFTAAEEATALEIANQATAEQLTAGGVTTSPRNIILNNRPWSNLQAVAAYSGIGPSTMGKIKAMVATWQGVVNPPAALTVQALANEAATHGSSSQYYDQLVSIDRAIITSDPFTSSAGNTSFWIADPSAGNAQQLKVYIASTANLNTSFASTYDDIKISGVFNQYNTTFQVKLDDAAAHTASLNISGLEYADYKTVQAAWHGTAANPEGAVRIISTFDYTYMVPLPLLLAHPMWNGSPPGPPADSGNEQDVNWNIAAQQALDAWRAGGGN